MKKYIVVMLFSFLMASCGQETEKIHLGENLRDKCHLVCMDSLKIVADSLSGNGNFYMKDSVLTFADMTLCTLFHFNLNNCKELGHNFDKGNGRNEFSSLMYAYPINGSDKYYAMDSSLGFYIYDDRKGQIDKISKLDFGWNDKKQDFDSPALYNLMYMTEFGMNISKVNDSTLMLPVSIIDRYLTNITKKRYEEGHIFAEVNSNNFKVTKVFGNFPDIFKGKPSNVLEFFQYDKIGDTLYVNHSVDSLVYVYKYPDKLLYTIGFEAQGAKRDYPERLVKDHSVFKEDVAKLSINSGLKFDNGYLVRTVMLNMLTGETVMQIYSKDNLVGEFKMPSMFKYLGYYNGYFYGISLLPRQENDKFYYMRYKFKLAINEK